jgi:hypothetical protein
MLFVSASNKSSLADLILKTSELSSQRKLTSTSAGSTAFSEQILFSLAINCFAVRGFGLLCVLVYCLTGLLPSGAKRFAMAEHWRVAWNVADLSIVPNPFGVED